MLNCFSKTIYLVQKLQTKLGTVYSHFSFFSNVYGTFMRKNTGLAIDFELRFRWTTSISLYHYCYLSIYITSIVFVTLLRPVAYLSSIWTRPGEDCINKAGRYRKNLFHDMLATLLSNVFTYLNDRLRDFFEVCISEKVMISCRAI